MGKFPNMTRRMQLRSFWSCDVGFCAREAVACVFPGVWLVVCRSCLGFSGFLGSLISDQRRFQRRATARELSTRIENIGRLVSVG